MKGTKLSIFFIFSLFKKMKKPKQDKGVAGLTILLSLVVMIFIIGLLITIFAIMGDEMKESTYDAGTGSLTNATTVGVVNSSTGVYPTGLTGLKACALTITRVAKNNATGSFTIASGNYTNTACVIRATSSVTAEYNNTAWNITGTYTYDKNNTATDVMSDTVAGLKGATDWFDIFIVIGAMVVLIILTVIIVTSIKSSGMVEGTRNGASNVGTA